MTGYLHPRYAESLAEFGQPLRLARSGGWLLKRPVDGHRADAMGIYPLFSCTDWKSLSCDFKEIGNSLVSAVLVADPFGEYDETLLRTCFGDLVAPFKSHFVYDLALPLAAAVSKHHARNASIGRNNVAVEHCDSPSSQLDDWIRLYSVLIGRHHIDGIRAFSRQSFVKQLSTPGIVCFRAVYEHQTVGMILWYVQKSVAYYHLGAYTDEGYELRASFALFWKALEYFATSGVKYADLGAGAGAGVNADDGLTRFKRGWSSSVRTAYLCGRIFNREEYDRLTRERAIQTTDYFPAYRKGEFN